MRGMTSEFVFPTLQGSFVCEDVRQEVQGNQTVIGILNAIPTVQVPVGLIKFCIWTRWTNGLGAFQQTTRLLDPNEKRLIDDISINVELKHLEAHATNVHMLAGVQFSEFGVHHIEILMNDALVIRYPLAVVKVNLPVA